MKYKKIIWEIIIIGFFVLWTILLYKFPPQEIVENIGVNNGYILALAVTFLGGTSLFLPFPYYLVIFSLGAGGLNPLLLGLLGGIGIILGDSTSYLVGHKGHKVVPKKVQKRFIKIYHWCNKHPPWLIPIFLFFYAAIVPLPDDFIVVPMGLIRYSYWKVILPLGLGKIVFNTIMAMAGFYGFDLFFS